ncbi:class II fructose-bisphosphate aldolase [Deinococcus cellulosilyticus]|uniref:Fructose-bisphosphate aldolase n=1 Tax=Deinococcus cellulosilyticus (strain DSM 18568 / NBRC 106333 / KACC 11606 / 5516J-15) TaxID=1223518 RepID=A0A511N1P6_DEIC1|nr:class II fructose-bisphosphate aldolase [Deinococcus cellulosilyticus]GEM46266.1 hypothetical protein DC3_19010 [Deinococcus cellulosilyticus NBRC 106333 = KACC 11606]
MPFVPDGREVYRQAFERHELIPAFNVCSIEMVRGCIEAAEETKATIILQAYPTDLEQFPAEHFQKLVESMAWDSSATVLTHLDHGKSVEMVLECLRAGFSSVMFDGEALQFEDTLEASQYLHRITSQMGAALEVSAESFNQGFSVKTTPERALQLKHAGADTLAVSVGSEHGQASKLDLQLLSEIQSRVNLPLVLHGGSGVSPDDLAAARNLGVVKINIGSSLYRALRGVWDSHRDHPNHRNVYATAREAIRSVAKEKIQVARLEKTR